LHFALVGQALGLRPKSAAAPAQPMDAQELAAILRRDSEALEEQKGAGGAGGAGTGAGGGDAPDAGMAIKGLGFRWVTGWGGPG
jgi:hypothetical protein